ncbi:hypothetical protein ruthe_03142 [Rubellimicrobium thermophilum DSM 16684]|uniref:Uncharacterized protein n=1 Tax=Rubellimicrobium thermophilum DSM 16684 TaxID=1123069 RepID=S9S8V4_9RHOB|nr:hypothetical protein ruthe_03142 [Rubellimicrobium thermophilum DSM 16684]
MIEQVFGALEPFGKLLANRLFDHAGAGKADQCAGFGDLDIAQHRIGGRHPPRGGMGEHDDIGQARILDRLQGDSRAGHLHQRQDPLLHPRAPCGGEEDQGALQLYRALGGSDHRIADIEAHRSGHEGEVMGRGDDRGAMDFALGDQHRLLLAGGLARLPEAIDITLLIPELERVGDRLGDLDLGEDATVEQRLEAVAGLDRHVMAAMGADIEMGGQLPVEQHLPAFVAFGPEILGNLATGEDRGDPRADVVGDPVHGCPPCDPEGRR